MSMQMERFCVENLFIHAQLARQILLGTISIHSSGIYQLPHIGQEMMYDVRIFPI